MPQNLDICCTTFCAEACSVAVKVTDTEATTKIDENELEV